MMVIMVKVAGVQAHVEAANFLNDKIGEPYISNYINHVTAHPSYRNAPHAIIPNIHAFNFPFGRQRINDDSEASMAVKSIFEVKTMTACPLQYGQENVNTTAVAISR
jgi:hypothetical protein